MIDMHEIPWMYRRDQFDLIFGRAARLLGYCDFAESVLLQEAYSEGRVAFVSPRDFTSLGSHRITDMLHALYFEAHRNGELRYPELLRLLARIDTVEFCISVDAAGQRKMERCPKPDRPATRKDLLYSYLLSKLVYLEMKAKLQNRQVTPQELASFADAVSTLVDLPNAPADSVESAKLQLIKAWQQCPWESSDVIPEYRRPFLKRCWSAVISIFRSDRGL